MVPVKCMFNDAKRRGDIRENPCELIRRFTPVRPTLEDLFFSTVTNPDGTVLPPQ